MLEAILDEMESRDLSQATLAELALWASTTARYGLGGSEEAPEHRCGVMILPAESWGTRATDEMTEEELERETDVRSGRFVRAVGGATT